MKNWKAVLCAIFGIVAVVFISVYGATSAGKKPYDPSLMANWLQAIGSVAAIGGAYLFGERQAAHAKNQAKEQLANETKRQHSTYIAIANYAVQGLDKFASNAINGDTLSSMVMMMIINADSIADRTTALRAIPLVNLPNESAIQNLTGLIERLRKLDLQLKEFSPGAMVPAWLDPNAAKITPEQIRCHQLLSQWAREACVFAEKFSRSFV